MAGFAERFWARVEKTDSCWLWQSNLDTAGYGQISLNGRLTRASRAAWELTHGPIADGLWVLHHCDNPPCVRPDHLYLGNAKDNARDMVQRNRNWRGGAGTPTRGTLSACAKLTEEQVADMRRTYRGARGEQTTLAARYGVDRSTISKIVTGHGWPHVATGR